MLSAQVVMRPTSLSERDFRPLPRPLPASTGQPCCLVSMGSSSKRGSVCLWLACNLWAQTRPCCVH